MGGHNFLSFLPATAFIRLRDKSRSVTQHSAVNNNNITIDHSPITMADQDIVFDQLGTKYVPHILEKIFFALDFESFKTAIEVSDTWRRLLTSEPFQRLAKLRFRRDIEEDEKMLYLDQEDFTSDARKVQRLLSLGFIDIDRPMFYSDPYSEAISGGPRCTWPPFVATGRR